MLKTVRHEVKVNRKELLDGLVLLRKTAKPKNNMEALISFEKGTFIVFINGVSVEASASGEFPGLVRIPAIKATELSKVLPSEDPLTIAHDQQRLFIGSFSMSCSWHNVEPIPIQLPMNPPFTVLLGLPMKYSTEQIFQSGLTRSHDEAERRRKMLTTKAFNLLREFEVSRTEVEELVAKAIRRANGQLD